MPVRIAELNPRSVFLCMTSTDCVFSFLEFFAYSSTIFPVPSGELSSTTIISVSVPIGRCLRNESSMPTIFLDSLYVGTITERDFECLVTISFCTLLILRSEEHTSELQSHV